MATKRKRSDPQATRYRIALTALAKAERRHKAAEAAIRALRAKVRRYERALPPERRAEIHAGTAAARAKATATAETWRQARRTLLTAARVAGIAGAQIMELRHQRTKRQMAAKKLGRRYALCVMMPEHRCLVWDVRRGWMTGDLDDRRDPSKLRRVGGHPIAWRAAA